MNKTSISTVIVAMFLSSVAYAGDFGFKAPPAVQGWPHLITKYCCDDYVPKCMPIAKPVCNYVCDDYMPKCLPCVKPVSGFVCDDYCAKPLPVLNCPPKTFLRCPPPEKHHVLKDDVRVDTNVRHRHLVEPLGFVGQTTVE